MNQHLLEDSDSQAWAVALGDVGDIITALLIFFFCHKRKKTSFGNHFLITNTIDFSTIDRFFKKTFVCKLSWLKDHYLHLY